MRVVKNILVAGLMFTSVVASANAQELLGDLLGGSGDNSLVTLNSGSASNSGLVNVGLGGDNGSVADINIGGNGSNSIATGNVTLGGDDGTSVNANILRRIGGGGVDVNIHLGGPNLIPVIRPVPGPVPNPNPNPVLDPLAALQRIATRGGGGAANCGTDVSSQIEGLMSGNDASAAWSSATGVQVQRIDVCPEMRSWLAEYMQTSGRSELLQPAVRADSLISASLSRSSYGTDHVFAVKKQGDRLVVFVY